MKKFSKLMGIVLSSLTLLSCSDLSGRKDEIDGKHLPDDDSMGKGILDDGGDIVVSEPEKIATGVELEGEHAIVIGTDTDKYELTGGATDTATWNNADFGIKRVRTANKEQSIIIPVDYSAVTDTSNMGFMFTLINNRKYTQIAVSIDEETWIDVGYGDSECNGVKADYSKNIDNLLGHTVTDSNLYQCYYKIGKYTKSKTTLYIKAGYSEDHANNLPSPTGADIIGMVAWYEKMEITYSLL